MSLLSYTPEVEVEHCISRERVERAAAGSATHPNVASSHHIMAERYADRAWSISEEYDLPYLPSGLWQ